MKYSVWLFGLSLLFLVVERFWPRNPSQRILRRGIWTDLAYLIFNSEYLGVLLGVLSIRFFSWYQIDGPAFMKDRPFLLQFFVLLLAFDFAQW